MSYSITKADVARVAANIKKASANDVSTLKDAVERYESRGMVKEAKEARTLLDKAEKNLARNVEEISKAAEKIYTKVNRTVHVESADEIAAAYARVNKKAASVDPKDIHGFAEFDKNGNIRAYHINKDSAQAMSYTLGHEVTHGFESLGKEYDDFATKLKEFVGDDEWQYELDHTSQVYKGVENANPEKEAVANLVGRYLFDEDGKYMKHLLDKEPSLFARIYDFVKKLIKGTSKRDADLEALGKRKPIYQR